MKIDWAFQRNEDGSSQGWNDPSIAEFKSNRLENLTREVIQNSLDAALNDDQAVFVEFKEEIISSDLIPNIETLRDIVKLCDKDTGLQNQDMIKEFKVAKDVIIRNEIRVLSISDSYTKGMEGPCIPGKPFYQYLKTVGQSGGSTDRAGSHGIGKAAPLACSDLRTIFISTVWEDDGVRKGLVQGRAVLMSFRREDGIYKSTGYWGDAESYDPIEPDNMPEKYGWILRDEIGTTVHVVGWSDLVSSDWAKLVIGYAVSNYFPAFIRGKLILRVKNHEVNKDNILQIINNKTIYKAMQDEGVAEKIDDARHYINCLSEESNTQIRVVDIENIGSVLLRINVADNAPRKIALIRNNMLITDAIPFFWKRVPGKYKDFVGLVEVLDSKGSQFIRLMEPPSHNSLSIDFLPTLHDKKLGKIGLESLSQNLKDIVNEIAGGDNEEFGVVDFMAEYFADEAGDDRGQGVTDEVDPNGNFRLIQKPINRKSSNKILIEPQDLEDDSEDDNGDGQDGADDLDGNGQDGGGFRGGSGKIEDHYGPNSGKGDGSTSKDANSEGKSGNKFNISVKLIGTRIVKSGDNAAIIYFTPTENIDAILTIYEVGSDFDDPFQITHTSIGTLENGGLVAKFTKDRRMTISVVLSRPIIGGLKVVAVKSKNANEAAV